MGLAGKFFKTRLIIETNDHPQREILIEKDSNGRKRFVRRRVKEIPNGLMEEQNPRPGASKENQDPIPTPPPLRQLYKCSSCGTICMIKTPPLTPNDQSLQNASEVKPSDPAPQTRIKSNGKGTKPSNQQRPKVQQSKEKITHPKKNKSAPANRDRNQAQDQDRASKKSSSRKARFKAKERSNQEPSESPVSQTESHIPHDAPQGAIPDYRSAASIAYEARQEAHQREYDYYKRAVAGDEARIRKRILEEVRQEAEAERIEAKKFDDKARTELGDARFAEERAANEWLEECRKKYTEGTLRWLADRERERRGWPLPGETGHQDVHTRRAAEYATREKTSIDPSLITPVPVECKNAAENNLPEKIDKQETPKQRSEQEFLQSARRRAFEEHGLRRAEELAQQKRADEEAAHRWLRDLEADRRTDELAAKQWQAHRDAERRASNIRATIGLPLASLGYQRVKWDAPRRDRQQNIRRLASPSRPQSPRDHGSPRDHRRSHREQSPYPPSANIGWEFPAHDKAPSVVESRRPVLGEVYPAQLNQSLQEGSKKQWNTPTARSRSEQENIKPDWQW